MTDLLARGALSLMEVVVMLSALSARAVRAWARSGLFACALACVFAVGLGGAAWLERAHANAAPTPLHAMLASADLVVVGQVIALDAETFTLAVEEALYGDPGAATVRVTRFHDWGCGARYAPYAVGQREVVILRRVEGQAAPYQVNSSTGEAEMALDGAPVPLRYELIGEAYPDLTAPAADVLDAMRGFRAVTAPGADPAAVAAYRARSPLHAHLLARAGR